MTHAHKLDQGKPNWSLIPFRSALEGVVRVLEFGKAKYGRDNWKKGMQFSRPYDAALRHMFKWWDGNNLDEESGLSHLDHAICELVFLRHYIHDAKYNKFDDRREQYES